MHIILLFNLKSNNDSLTPYIIDYLPKVSTEIIPWNINDIIYPFLVVIWKHLSFNDGFDFLLHYIVCINVTNHAASEGSRRNHQLVYTVTTKESLFNFTDIKPYCSYNIGVNAAVLVDGLVKEVVIYTPVRVESMESC